MILYNPVVLRAHLTQGGSQLNKMSILAIMIVIFLFASTVPFVAAEGGEGDSTGISVTDSRGITTNLTGPAVHVAAFGAFATNTLVDIGQLEKAVVFDASSEYSKSGIEEVKNYSADMFITVSSANKDMVVQTMLGLADNGTWNKTTDVIFGYGYSYLATIWSELEGYGFHVITFYPNSYDGIVQVVEDIETVVGANHAVSENMTYVKSYIGETLLENGVNETSEKITAIYVSYSSSVYKLGNGGSVTVDFINFAGGNNVANDTSKAVPTYAVDLTAIVQLSPEYVLLDGYYTGSADDFSALLGDDSIQVYKMNKTWNTYSPDASVGLWTVACLFYPQYFSGALPTIPVVPDAPTDLSVVASDGFVTLTWTAPLDEGGADIDYYVVYMNGTEKTNSTSTSVNVTGLVNGVEYSFMVAAHNSVGLGNNSTSIVATPAATVTVPGVPFGLIATVGVGYANLSWTAPTNDGGAAIDYYVIYMNGTEKTTTAATYANITDLTNGWSYTFVVAAHNSEGMSANSTAINATPFVIDDDGEDGGNDLLIYVGVGIGVIIVAIAAVIIMRRD